jgi:energy-coupling factor transporter transmembrane protein EcfT
VLDQLPIGTSIPVASFIQRLRARTKLLLVLWLAILFFFANRKHFHFGAYLAGGIVLTLAILASRIPFPYIWSRISGGACASSSSCTSLACPSF